MSVIGLRRRGRRIQCDHRRGSGCRSLPALFTRGSDVAVAGGPHMLAAVRSATFLGIEGRSVTVEVHVSTGLPASRSSACPTRRAANPRPRARAAVMSSGLPWPSCRMTVNLAPSNQRKGGSGLDLAIAIGLLIANGEIAGDAVTDLGFVGELGLDGSLRAVAGVAPMVGALHDLTAVVPRASFHGSHGHLARLRAGGGEPSRGHRRAQWCRAMA